MTKMKVAKPFHDIEQKVKRNKNEVFTASNARALHLAKLGLIEIIEIEPE